MACKFIKCREWHAKICQLAVHGHHDLAASPLLFLGKSIPQCHDLPRFFFALKSFAQRKPHQLNLLEGFTMDFARKNIMVCSWKCEWGMSKSQSNSAQIWTNLNKTQLDFKAFDSWPWRPWLVRSARRLIFACAVAFVTSPSSKARRRAFLRQSRATTHAMKNEGSACSRGLDLMILSTAHRWGTNYALIMHWLCSSLQFGTAVGQREEIVTDSHCRAADFVLLRLQLERTNSEWSKLLLASESWESESVPDGSCLSLAHDWGRLRPTWPLSAQHALSLRKQSSTKWEKLKCVKCVGWNHFEIFAHSVKSVSLCRKSVFGKSSAELPKTRERCDKFAGRIASRLRIQISDTEKLQNYGLIEWIIWIIWNYKLNFRTKTYSIRC